VGGRRDNESISANGSLVNRFLMDFSYIKPVLMRPVLKAPVLDTRYLKVHCLVLVPMLGT
jgi:hypothetical protein